MKSKINKNAISVGRVNFSVALFVSLLVILEHLWLLNSKEYICQVVGSCNEGFQEKKIV